MWVLEIKPRSSGRCSKYFPTEPSPQQPNSPAKPSLTAVIFYLIDCFEQLAHFSNASLSYIQIQYTFPFLSSSGFLFFLSWHPSLLCIDISFTSFIKFSPKNFSVAIATIIDFFISFPVVGATKHYGRVWCKHTSNT